MPHKRFQKRSKPDTKTQPKVRLPEGYDPFEIQRVTYDPNEFCAGYAEFMK